MCICAIVFTEKTTVYVQYSGPDLKKKHFINSFRTEPKKLRSYTYNFRKTSFRQEK